MRESVNLAVLTSPSQKIITQQRAALGRNPSRFTGGLPLEAAGPFGSGYYLLILHDLTYNLAPGRSPPAWGLGQHLFRRPQPECAGRGGLSGDSGTAGLTFCATREKLLWT